MLLQNIMSVHTTAVLSYSDLSLSGSSVCLLSVCHNGVVCHTLLLLTSYFLFIPGILDKFCACEGQVVEAIHMVISFNIEQPTLVW